MNHLAAAQEALNGGRAAEAIDHLKAAVDANPAQPAGVYRALALQCYRAGRNEEGARYTEIGARQHPRDYDLLNTRGVILRRLKRYDEAAAVLEAAVKLNPKQQAAQTNLGNVLLDLGAAARAEQTFAKLARLEPRNAEHQRQLGRALLKQGKQDQAIVRLKSAVALKKDYVDAWLDLAGLFSETHQTAEAEEICDKALAANPGEPRVLEAKAVVMRRAGLNRKAEAFLRELLASRPDAAWIHYQLGCTIADWDREGANTHLRRACELTPGKLDYVTALVESLERTRSGDEGANIEEGYQLALTILDQAGEFTSAHQKIMNEVLIRVCDYESLARLGDFKTLGRNWAVSGRHTALLKQLARVKTLDDRLELVEQHRLWGERVEAQAARQPIRRPARRGPREKVRLGLMSSDLRGHPVGYFALPLFEHLDRDRFEVFVYSYFQGQQDQLQTYITQQVTAYRWWPEISARDAAQKIAEDDLDILLELGGSTHMNKLEVMAYRAAPRQASWLGYPHSAGLSTIDYLICDPYCVPADLRLLIEKPLMMPKSWIGLGRMVFSDAHQITPGLPEDRAGVLTFGTANNPHKYHEETFALWARVLQAVPGSRFRFLRPEGSSESFRRNIVQAFEQGGVAAERITFEVKRGAHMPFYNDIDITLDPIPLTGGTTTTEALWMGVPVVSLIGPAFFERLSRSILENTGVGDMATEDPDRYVQIAVELAADKARRLALRTELRENMRTGPLGQTEAFARDFYDLLHRTVTEG